MWLSGGHAAWWTVTLGALPLALPLAWLSWHCVEQWALRWVRGKPRTQLVAPIVPGSVAGS
jgi:peptidoglycan/LPS O-acetylase OafA/YrhL